MKIYKFKTNKIQLALFIFVMSSFGFNVSQANELAASKKGDFARGATAWVNNCVRCHNVRDPKELRDDQWITTTFHMRIRAGLTGQQTRDIITFLQLSN